MHQKIIITAGKKIEEAKKAVIMLHGRGASAADILSLSGYLNTKDFAIMAPQATHHTWYPYSFLSAPSQNEPWLSSAIKVIDEVVEEIVGKGIKKENIYFVGFSQGACLTLEYISRNADKWGGAAAFTGGLIGDQLYRERYNGDFKKTPVYIGTSNPDPHVPVQRVKETEEVLKTMGANVTVDIFVNMGHTISQEEIDRANMLVFN